MSSEERGSPGAGTSTCTRQLAWAHCWARTPANFPFFFFLLGRKRARLSWPGKAKLPQPFVACKAEYRLSLSGCVTQSTFVVYLQQRVEGTALNHVGWRGARRRAVVGGGSAVFLNFHFWFSAELETLFLIVIFFFLMPGSKARSSAGINRLYFSVAEEGRRMHSSSGYNLPFLETWVLLFPDKNQITTFICSIIKYVNIFQKHNFPMTQSAFK